MRDMCTVSVEMINQTFLLNQKNVEFYSTICYFMGIILKPWKKQLHVTKLMIFIFHVYFKFLHVIFAEITISGIH